MHLPSPRTGRRACCGLLLGVALHAGLALPASAADAAVDPDLLVFDDLAPGDTAFASTTLRVDAPSGASVVRAGVTSSGELAPFLTTVVEACDDAWTADGCRPGATVLVDGPAASSASELRLPAAPVVHLRVGVSLSDDAPPDARGAVVYRLDLVGDTADDGAADGGLGGDGGGMPPLATTGADVAAAGAAALALVALGVALHRARRRADRRGTA